MALHSGSSGRSRRGGVRIGAVFLLASVLFVSCPGCMSEEPPEDRASRSPSTDASAPVYIETGDLPALARRGYLRILSPPHSHVEHLPRQGFPHDVEETLLADAAEALDLEVVRITVDTYQALIPALLAGKGDVIAANFTVTPERKARIAFSVPVAMVREQLITRAGDKTVRTPADLEGRTVVVRRSSAFWKTVDALRQRHPEIRLEAAPEYLDTEQILDRVATGEFDVTVADSNLMDAVSTYRSDLRVAFDLTDERPVAWGVRPDARDLLAALNNFLNAAKLTQSRPTESRDDLPGIRQHGVLRVLTRNNPATYFLWRGELLGFEYELARHFARQQGLRVEMVVPPSRDDLIPWLVKGRGDLIAASMTITPEREARGVAFSRPYFQASEIVVARIDDPPDRLRVPADLAGRTVVVRRSSAYWQTLAALQARGIALDLDAAPEEMETEEIIAKVAAGKYDLTVADSHLLDIELTWREDIRAAFPLGDPKPHGWVMRASNPRLLDAVNRYWEQSYRGTFYNLARRKYFKNPRKIRSHVQFRVARTGELSPYDAIVRRYAERYGFDWRLIVAQMYQESRFDPEARSWAGAVGLMQVLPRTARSLGFPEIRTPENGIHAGIKYLHWVRERFEPELPVQDRMWFALAGYNAGHGHVIDARRLARKLGLNPNRWFGHVEKAILLLARRQYARQARHGYCRGSEPVNYVREIKHRYDAYLRVAEQ